MRLVLVAVTGTQRYVFASNRLREAVGASHLVSSSTTDWVHDVLGDTGGQVLQESSGRTVLVVETGDEAARLARALTSKAWREAPGLDLAVVSVPIEGDKPTSDEVNAVFAEADRHRSGRASPLARFPRLPVTAPCASTDLPAKAWHSDVPAREDDQAPQPFSAEVLAKRAARRPAVDRMAGLLDRDSRANDLRLIDIDEYYEDIEWSAVVHADANRLGDFFRVAGEVLPERGELSRDIAGIGERAFVDAVCAVGQPSIPVPVVPLVIGGDDLTVLVAGTVALAFVEAYLDAFTRHSDASEIVRRVLDHAGRRALTVSAGVAIVKPNFPFSTAYGLSEQLCRSAKALVAKHDGCHGLDVHVLIDSQVTDLAAIRAGYQVDGLTLTERPYLLPTAGDISAPPQQDWRMAAGRVRKSAKGADEETVVTRSQLHALRTELRTDQERARRRVDDLRQRATTEPDRDLLKTIKGYPPFKGEVRTTPVLDMLELAEFVGRRHGGAR